MEISLDEEEIQLVLAKATENILEQLTGFKRDKMTWGIAKTKIDKKERIEFNIKIY